jgi:mannose-6-phosphate isomerase-like protein (cupin superfamily)
MARIDRETAPHYVWGSGCDGWHLVQTPTLSISEERMPPGTSEIRHYHCTASQFFYVLRGNLCVETGGVDIVLRAGQGKPVPAGEPHQVRNRSLSDVEFLVVSQPPSHGDRVAIEGRA